MEQSRSKEREIQRVCQLEPLPVVVAAALAERGAFSGCGWDAEELPFDVAPPIGSSADVRRMNCRPGAGRLVTGWYRGLALPGVDSDVASFTGIPCKRIPPGGFSGATPDPTAPLPDGVANRAGWVPEPPPFAAVPEAELPE